MRAEELTAEFGIAGVLDFVETEHGLVKAGISLDGVTGELYLQGAQLTAWQPSDERPVVFTSPNSAFAPGRAICGGIPIVFPWFGASRRMPTAPQHGFARVATWHLDAVETAGGRSLTLTLSLGDGDVGSPFWPERFRAIYTVTFAQTLSLRLAVQNRVMHPILFEEALHSYFAISDVAEIAISGLAGATYIDKTDAAHRKVQTMDLVTITAETDRVYLDTPGQCVIEDRRWRRRIVIVEGRRRVERGVEPLGRESGRHGRSRRPRLARHGLRRDREHRRQRGPARGRRRIPDVDSNLRSCSAVTLPAAYKYSAGPILQFGLVTGFKRYSRAFPGLGPGSRCRTLWGTVDFGPRPLSTVETPVDCGRALERRRHWLLPQAGPPQQKR